MINLLFYIFYIFIVESLIKYLNINIIIKIIKTIFYYSNNTFFILSIIVGIIVKIFISNKKKFHTKIIPLIVIDIIKMLLFKYSMLTILISLLLTTFISKKYINNKIYKGFIIFLYIILPINIYILHFKITNKKDSYLIMVPTILYFVLTNINVIIKYGYQNILISILFFIISYIFYENKHKKRNIIIIFLIFIYLLYYSILP